MPSRPGSWDAAMTGYRALIRMGFGRCPSCVESDHAVITVPTVKSASVMAKNVMTLAFALDALALLAAGDCGQNLHVWQSGGHGGRVMRHDRLAASVV